MNIYKQYRKINQKISVLRLRVTGKSRHAANPDYDIRKSVYLGLKSGSITAETVLPKVDNTYQKTFLDDLCVMANNRLKGIGMTCAQIGQAREFLTNNRRHMTTEYLDAAEKIAMCSGLLVLAHAIHKENEQLILSHTAPGSMYPEKFLLKQYSTAHNAAKLFWSKLNSGDDKAVTQALRHPIFEKRPGAAQHYRNLCAVMGILPKDREPHKENPENAQFAGFAGFVKGKKIAIIGPSSSGADYSEEIANDFDIIIRTNYSGVSNLPEAQQRLMPHISYYRWYHMKQYFLNSDENIDYLKDLKFAVLKRRNNDACKRVSGYTGARYVNEIQNFFFTGSPNMIPLILQDLSGCEPAGIKIFYANFFLTDSIHDAGYKTFEKDTLSHWRSNGKHNLICQYEYVMHLYNRGIIDADPRLADILTLGTEDYMKQMEIQENRKSLQ